MTAPLWFRQDCAAEARSLENPSTALSDPDEWLLEAFAGGRSKAGARVNRDAALSLSAWWRGIFLISSYVGKLPIHLYRRSGENKEIADRHPAYRLLRFGPNPEMTAFTWRQVSQAHVLQEGNGYTYVLRNGAGQPLELWPLNPGVTYPVRANGVLWYVTQVDGQLRKLPAGDVIHVKGMGFDGLVGYPVIRYARELLGGAIAKRDHGNFVFGSGQRPDFVLEHPATLSEAASTNLRHSWGAMHQGLDRSHRPAILQENMKLQVLQWNNREAQWLEGQKFDLVGIANFLGLPPHKLGDTSRTSYGSLEQENQSFLDDSLDPHLVNWEQELRAKLLTEDEKAADSHVIEFLREAVVRVNLQVRYAAYSSALNAGWLNRDEVRALENRNPMPDGKGKIFLEPQNMKPAGDGKAGDDPPADPPPPPPPPAEDDGGQDEEKKK